MKRYRILSFDFDSRASLLSHETNENWDKLTKNRNKEARSNTIKDLQSQHGEERFNIKLQNFMDLGNKPISVVSYHNELFQQSRDAFVIGCYYPALTSVCALGERILNHLVLNLRDNFMDHELYKKVCNKKSFDNWELTITALSQWEILTKEATESFRSLSTKRNTAIHFNPETEKNTRQLALEAIKNFTEIINNQFSVFGTLPWLFLVNGEVYIKKEWEPAPFVKLVYIPNSVYVGYKHFIKSMFPYEIQDANDYELTPTQDTEFLHLREQFKNGGDKYEN